jgi:hypothetical protein
VRSEQISRPQLHSSISLTLLFGEKKLFAAGLECLSEHIERI